MQRHSSGNLIMNSPNSSSPLNGTAPMTPVSKDLLKNLPEDSEIWENLKHAIAASSGFQRWQIEQDLPVSNLSVDTLIRRYLRETLETLAY